MRYIIMAAVAGLGAMFLAADTSWGTPDTVKKYWQARQPHNQPPLPPGDDTMPAPGSG